MKEWKWHICCGENVLFKISYPTAGKNDLLKTWYTQVNSFQLAFLVTSTKNRSHKEWTQKRYQILWQTSKATPFLRKKLYGNFLWIQFKSLNPVQSFQGDSLLLTTESLGVLVTLLINLAMETRSGFKWVNPGLVIGNHNIDSLLFQYNSNI